MRNYFEWLAASVAVLILSFNAGAVIWDVDHNGKQSLPDAINTLQVIAGVNDADGDGFSVVNGDCNDHNSTIHPGAEEIAGDSVDSNCDGDDYYAPFTNSLGMSFIIIKAGTFNMGSISGGNSMDQPVHAVTLTQPFYMMTTEVTQGQWLSLMGNNPSYFSSCGTSCPVEDVDWSDVQNFITALNALGEGTYGLPTEAEWEYAARAGANTDYSFGDDSDQLGNYAWYGSNSGYKSHIVAQKLPNAWGLYDMSGNVWEWCQDWYGSYPSGPVTDPIGPATGNYRMVRGGSLSLNEDYCRVSRRYFSSPDNKNSNIGLRLVCAPSY